MIEMKSLERKLGEVFEILDRGTYTRKVKVKVVEKKVACNGCYFDGAFGGCMKQSNCGVCMSFDRSDKSDVRFVET